MKVIKPTVLTSATLYFSNVAENDYAGWSSVTAYTVGQFCIKTSTHRIYQCLVANTNFDPETNLTGANPKWLDYAPTNRWAMFDDVVGTKTTIATQIDVYISAGNVGALSLLGIVGNSVTITMWDYPGGTQVYNKVISLDATPIGDVYDWLTLPYEQLTDIAVTDLPSSYPYSHLYIGVTANTGNASVGVCKFGLVTDLGFTQYGASVGIIDYSVKTTDAFGNYFFTKRAFAKHANFTMQQMKSRFNLTYRKLANLRAIPCIWIPSEDTDYAGMLIYGIYKDFSIEISYPTVNLCSLELEGLT